MKILRHAAVLSVVMTAALPCALTETAGAQTNPAPGFAALEAEQNAVNAQPGPRTVPGRSIPVPDTVSPQVQAEIAAPYRIPNWDANPQSPAEWKELVATLAARAAAAQPAIREKLGVTMQPTVIGGVKAFILAPKAIPPANRNRLLVHVHGGGYVYNPGEAGTQEAT